MTNTFRFLDTALEHWANLTPDAPAVRTLGQDLSYGGLNETSNQIASALLAMGVSHGDRVILHAVKSAQAIAAAFAILRIGAIYVPIDPNAPDERVKTQVKSVKPRCILTDAARKRWHANNRATQPCLDISQNIRARIDLEIIQQNAIQRDPEDGAYILMTSGSTGVPKGIYHSHKSGLAYAGMARALCALAPADRVSHHTPLHFDMSIFDIYSTVLAGACCVVIPEMHSKMPASLASLVEQEQITVWYSVPYALIQLCERGALEKSDLSSLRVVMFAGETMPPAALRKFAAFTPDALFINAYGPTETNHCTSAKMRFEDLDGVSAVPIGRPEIGVDAKILNDGREADSGELLIASDQLMQGYWQNTALTQQSFATLADATGQLRTYYRTGDLVERRKDGTLMLLGRKDRQIKLRGYRIELDEIERSLTNASGVSEAAVVFEAGSIIAFVTGANLPAAPTIKNQIAGQLPPYAQPEHIVPLDHFDRTSTGKIDRKALIGHFNG